MFLQAPGNEDCFARAKQLAGIMGVAGVPVGFFRAHVTLKVSTRGFQRCTWTLGAPQLGQTAFRQQQQQWLACLWASSGHT
jgi:hypothetical protein